MGVESSNRRFECSVEINVTVHAAYELWANCENFPRFMQGIQEVYRVDARHLHWRAQIWDEVTEWDAEILEEIPDVRISWATVTGDRIAGIVTFTPLGGGRVQVTHAIELQGVEEEEAESIIHRRISQDLERFRDFAEKRSGKPESTSQIQNVPRMKRKMIR